MANIKYCPITSGRGNTYLQRVCEEEKCAFWDEELNQCVIKTMALAAVAKPFDSTAQSSCAIPDSYHHMNTASDIHFRLSPDK